MIVECPSRPLDDEILSQLPSSPPDPTRVIFRQLFVSHLTTESTFAPVQESDVTTKL